MKIKRPLIKAGIENFGLKNNFEMNYRCPSDFQGPPIFKIFFCTKGTTLLFFVFLVKNQIFTVLSIKILQLFSKKFFKNSTRKQFFSRVLNARNFFSRSPFSWYPPLNCSFRLFFLSLAAWARFPAP